VVKPFFFSGGDIGRPEVTGTVNDIVAIGVKPYALAYARMLKLKRVLLKDTLC
jgi:hydrogenase maturation factor